MITRTKLLWKARNNEPAFDQGKVQLREEFHIIRVLDVVLELQAAATRTIEAEVFAVKIYLFLTQWLLSFCGAAWPSLHQVCGAVGGNGVSWMRPSKIHN